MKYVKAFSGILISIIFMFFSLRSVNFSEVMQVIYGINCWYLLLAFLASVSGLIIRSLRWRIIITREDLPVGSFFEATCVGQMTNNVLPFRAGDLAQAYFLSFREKLAKSLALSSVIIERLSDLCPPILILVISSYFVLLPKEINRGKILIFTGTLFISLLFFLAFNKIILSFLENILPENNLKKKIHSIIQQFYSGLGFIKKKRVAFKMILYSATLWANYGLICYFSLQAFNIHIGYMGALLITCITAISAVIPSSPGYIGTWEFFTILALKIFELEKDIALSFALIYHFINWITVTAIGFFILMRSGFSITKLNKT